MKAYATEVTLLIKPNPCGVMARYDGKPLPSIDSIRVGKYNVIKGESFEWKGVVKSMVSTAAGVVLVMVPNTKTSNVFDGEMYVLNAQTEGVTDVNVLDSDIYKVVGFHGEAASTNAYGDMLRENTKKKKDDAKQAEELV